MHNVQYSKYVLSNISIFSRPYRHLSFTADLAFYVLIVAQVARSKNSKLVEASDNDRKITITEVVHRKTSSLEAAYSDCGVL